MPIDPAICLYRHDIASELIHLDDLTGHWQPREDDPDAPVFVDPTSVVQRADQAVRGSYTTENDRFCCLYWNNDRELIFRTHDGKRFRLFKRECDGMLTHMTPHVQADLQAATYADGREMRGMSTFRLRDGTGSILYAITYDSLRYCEMYGMASMLTFIPDEDLGDWDFFVGAKKAIDQLKVIARACALLSADQILDRSVDQDLVVADTGAICPRTGVWAPCRDNGFWPVLSAGEVMPDNDGRSASWVLISGEC